MISKDKKPFPSQLRFDVANDDWVVVATSRSKRPQMFKSKEKEVVTDKRKCPFCHLTMKDKPIVIFSHNKEINLRGLSKLPKDWTTIDIVNKYPAFIPGKKLEERKEGKLYKVMNAIGSSEVVITRDHNKPWAKLEIEHIKEVLDIFQLRYKTLMKERLVNYISIFQNHGYKAGASISHPHSQIMAIPFIDVDLKRALSNSKRYFRRTGKYLQDQMNKFEEKDKKRIIFENNDFLAVCPFASKIAFEVIISPKKPSPYFERITENQKYQLAEAFKNVLSKLYKGLGNPSYNFYLRTSPCDGKNYDFYHWHWTIVPRTSIWGGFELGSKMEISTITPELAASYLRKQ